MKRFGLNSFAFGLILLLIVLLCACNPSKNANGAYVYKNDLSSDEQSLLKDKARYDYLSNDLQGFMYSDQPVLRIADHSIQVFGFILKNDVSERPLYHQKNELFCKDVSSFLVFDDPMVIMQRAGQKEDMIRIESAMTSATWIRDLIDLRQTMTVFGVNCQINDLFCSYVKDFDGVIGVVLYFETNQGGFVHYYEYAHSEDGGEWFSEQDFVGYVQQYFQYLLDNSYNENGEPLYGQMTFRAYLDVIRTELPHN